MYQKKVIAKKWGDEVVVYNCLNGDTHLLDIETYRVLSGIDEETFSSRKIQEIGDLNKRVKLLEKLGFV